MLLILELLTRPQSPKTHVVGASEPTDLRVYIEYIYFIDEEGADRALRVCKRIDSML